uniref:Uncharacterized protein n=1 Tax=Caenorhabditis tropicalis TaxID=1561998 RepID=A0A1I7TTR8_9PELO
MAQLTMKAFLDLEVGYWWRTQPSDRISTRLLRLKRQTIRFTHRTKKVITGVLVMEPFSASDARFWSRRVHPKSSFSSIWSIR